MVKTLCFQYRAREFSPWLGKFHVLCSAAKKKIPQTDFGLKTTTNTGPFIMAVTSFIGTLPHDLITSQRPHLQIPSPCCGLISLSCPTLWDPMDYSPPGSFVHGISQAKTLEWVAIPFSNGSSWPRGGTWVSCIAGGFFTIWATWEAQHHHLKVYDFNIRILGGHNIQTVTLTEFRSKYYLNIRIQA